MPPSVPRNSVGDVSVADSMLEKRAVPDSPLAGFNAQPIGDYIAQANAWNTIKGGAEKFEITACPTRSHGIPGVAYKITNNGAEIGNIPGAPIAFPSIFIGESFGRKPAGHQSVGMKQSEIKSAKFRFKTNAGADIARVSPEEPGIYNTAIDVWLGGNDRAPEEYLMIMPYNSAANEFRDGTGGGVGQPAGNIVKQSVVIAGIKYNIWRGTNHQGKSVVTFAAVPGQGKQANDLSADLNDFLAYARNGQFIASNTSLNNVYGGAEIWAGGKGLEVDFGIVVQRKQKPSDVEKSDQNFNSNVPAQTDLPTGETNANADR